MEEVSHKKYLNDYFQGYVYGSESRGELYNDDPRLGDARLCGTTASLCGIETAEYEKNKNKLERGIRLDIMLHAFLLTLSGIPVLYSGDEIGELNDYSYHDDPLKRDDSRYLHRGAFSWEDADKRKKKTTREGRIFSAIRELRKLRESHAVFDSGADTWVIDTWNIHVLAIGRYYEREKLIAFFNFSPEPQTVHTTETEDYTDLLSGEDTYLQDVELGEYGFKWVLHRY